MSMLAYFKKVPRPVVRLPKLPSELKEKLLFRYQMGSVEVGITVEAYQKYFDDLFVKRLAKNIDDIHDDAEDMIMKAYKADPSNNSLAVGTIYDREVEIGRDVPIPGMEALKPMFMGIPEGLAIGPVKLDTSYVIFVKAKNLATTVITYDVAKKVIREKLERKEIDEKELRLACEMCRDVHIVDHIDYSRYGLAAADVSKPWYQ